MDHSREKLYQINHQQYMTIDDLDSNYSYQEIDLNGNQAQLEEFMNEYTILKNDSEVLYAENQTLRKTIQDYTALIEKHETDKETEVQEKELLIQENRVLKNLLQLGWSEKDRLQSIQEQKDDAIQCLQELNKTQHMLEDQLKTSREQTAKLTKIAMGLGSIVKLL
jgi:hypothetical protein